MSLESHSLLSELICLAPAALSFLLPIVLGKVPVRGQEEGLGLADLGSQEMGACGKREKGSLGDPWGHLHLGKRV